MHWLWRWIERWIELRINLWLCSRLWRGSRFWLRSCFWLRLRLWLRLKLWLWLRLWWRWWAGIAQRWRLLSFWDAAAVVLYCLAAIDAREGLRLTIAIDHPEPETGVFGPSFEHRRDEHENPLGAERHLD